MRFAAALMVATYHLAYYRWLEVSPEVALPFFRWGWAGVQIFFVLSGFVIAISASGRTPAEFIKGRALRLYPTAWICATVTLIVAAWGQPGALEQFARTIVLWPVGPWIDAVYWTLAVEIVFYSIVLLALYVGLKIERVGLLLILVSGLYWSARLGNLVVGAPLHDVFAWLEAPPIGLALFTHGCFFGIGIMLWSISQDRITFARLAALAVAVGSGIASLIASARYFVRHDGGDHSQAMWPALIWLVALASIVASIVWNEELCRWLERCKRQIRQIGLATYPLYLVHNEVGAKLMVSLPHVAPRTAAAISLLAMLVVAFILLHAEQLVRRIIGTAAARRTE